MEAVIPPVSQGERRPLEERDHARGEQHEGQRDVVVGPRVLELELARIARERDVEPDRAAEGVDVRHEDAAHLGERDRQQDEVEAAQAEAEAEVADDGAEHGGERAADEHAEPRRQVELARQHRRGVAADADEGGVARTGSVRDSASDSAGGRGAGAIGGWPETRRDPAPFGIALFTPPGAARPEHSAGGLTKARPGSVRLAPSRQPSRPLPKRPAGRESKMRIRSAKLPSPFSRGWRKTAPSDSATETSSPPTNAPRRLPIPPMITMLNEATESESPVAGAQGRIGATSAPAAPTHAAPTPNASSAVFSRISATPSIRRICISCGASRTRSTSPRWTANPRTKSAAAAAPNAT